MFHYVKLLCSCLLAIEIGRGQCVSLNVSVSSDGYFLKPLFRGSEIFSLNTLERHFVSNDFYSYQVPSINVNYGTANSNHKIPQNVWKAAAKESSKYLGSVTIGNHDVRIHLIEDYVTSERHDLHVLYHKLNSKNTQRDGINNLDEREQLRSLPILCFVTGIKTELLSIASKCTIEQRESHCLTTSDVVQAWHSTVHKSNASVWYFAQSVNTIAQCEDIRQDIEEQLRNEIPDKKKWENEGLLFLSQLQLIREESSVRKYVVSNKTYIFIVTPQHPLRPGELFSVPIRLQQFTAWTAFTLRLRTRPGLRVIGVESQSKLWHITASEIAERGDWATVAVKLTSPSYYQHGSVEDIILWRCQVDPETHDTQSRLMMTLHDVTGEVSSKRDHKKMVVHVDIYRDNVIAVVPIVQTTDILNTAVLHGRKQSQQLVVYTVTSGGKVADVTAECACQSFSEQIVKVSKNCQSIYVDGSETSGGSGVVITIRYGRHLTGVSMLVWYPELPLSVEVSDDRLNLIKGWRIPPDRLASFGDISGTDRYGDWYEDGELSTLCEPKYQSAVVEVYTRFFIVDEFYTPRYFTDRKALLHLTDILARQLRVTDETVITLHDNIIRGQRPGAAEVQVLSASGVVLGKHTVRVVTDRVVVEELKTQLISSIQVEYVGIEHELSSDTIVIRMKPESKLTKRYQSGMLDVNISFSDGTTMPLNFFAPTDYQLLTESLDRHVIILSSDSTPAAPQLMALNPGSGQLVKVSLELSKVCQTKKSQPLAVGYTDVVVAFHVKEEESFSSVEDSMNDAAAGNYQHSSYYYDKKAGKKTSGLLHEPYMQAVDGNYGAQAQTYDENEPYAVPSWASTHQTGMYALLAVFSIATLFFVGNCVLFIVRCRQRMPLNGGEKMSDSQADGWVWLGPETLARNMVNMECSRTLMDEQVFNEGSLHGSLPPAYSGSPTSSSRGSSGCASRVSTYKGSECSIRIVSNPFETIDTMMRADITDKCDDKTTDNDKRSNLALEFANDDVSLVESLDGSASLKSQKSKTSIKKSQDVVPMDYQELMVYFENLKESIA